VRDKERERGMEEGSLVFAFSNWMDEVVPFIETEKMEMKSFLLARVRLEMPFGNLHKKRVLEFKREVD
jgi:hypothetical protein